MQLACRDRNRLALEADLIGASMHGIENISLPDRRRRDAPATSREARRVFDLDAPQLIALARSLDARPLPVGPPDRARAPLPRSARSRTRARRRYEYRVRRAAKKALAGARFLQLQICYRPELLERFMRAAARHRAQPSGSR